MAVSAQSPAAHPNAGANTSVYSSLDPKTCKTLKVLREEGASEQVCPGVAGFELRVLDGDSRQTITVVSPDGRQHPLRYQEVVSPNFNSVGPRAEWRLAAGGKVPIALTVRLNVSEDSANPSKLTSYLVVARVDAENVCVVKVIQSSASALDEARGVADHVSAMSCLKPAS